MHVQVEDFLPRGFPIGKEEINPVALQVSVTKCCRHASRHSEKVRGSRLVEVLQKRQMLPGNHQCVAESKGMDVQKGKHHAVFVDDVGGQPAGHDSAKDAICHVSPLPSPITQRTAECGTHGHPTAIQAFRPSNRPQ